MKKAKQVFKEYIQSYDFENGLVKLKIAHMYRVTEISRKIAEDLKLEQEDIELAELIGLLHDIGRFEQIRKYGTFIDGISIDHAQQGLQVLFEEGWIRKFIEDDQYDTIIHHAIWNHNKKEIEEGLSERELLHAKMIRDADKTDILYIITIDSTENTYGCANIEHEDITDEIMEDLKKNQPIDYRKRKTHADMVITHLAFVFDFNFTYGLKVVYEKDYLKQVAYDVHFTKEETKSKITQAYKITQKYMEERLGVK